MGVVLPKLVEKFSPNKSSRNGRNIDLIVVHDTEGGYEGACSWLCNPQADASAHVVLRSDGLEATQLVKYEDKAWACMDFNSRSLNLELEGFASKGYADGELRVAARVVAFWCHKFGVPAVYSGNGLKSGVTFHQDLGVAGGGHHDPGFSLAKKLWFVFLVKRELKRGGFRPVWGS